MKIQLWFTPYFGLILEYFTSENYSLCNSTIFIIILCWYSNIALPLDTLSSFVLYMAHIIIIFSIM